MIRTSLLLVAVSLVAIGSAQEAGFAQHVVGHVTRKTENNISIELRDFDNVSINDLLIADKGASAEIILFANGSRSKLTALGKCKIAASNFKQIAGNLITLKAVDKRFLRAIRGRNPDGGMAGTVARVNSDPSLSPREGARELPKVLEWTAVADATSVALTLSEDRREIFSKTLPGEFSSYPIASSLISSGHKYHWTVVSSQGSKVISTRQADFYALTPEENESLTCLEKAATKDPQLLGLLGVAYERLEMFSRANQVWSQTGK